MLQWLPKPSARVAIKVTRDKVGLPTYHISDEKTYIEDDYGKERIDRRETVVRQRMLKYLTLDAVDAEVQVLNKKDSNGGDKSYGNAYYQALAVDLVGALLPPRTDLTGEDDSDAGRHEISEERNDAGYRSYRINRSYT